MHIQYFSYITIVFVIKYRRKVIDNSISAQAKEIFEYIAVAYKITLMEWKHNIDHIHIVFRAHPKSELLEIRGIADA
jgi:putative transposase